MRCNHNYQVQLSKGIAVCSGCEKEIDVSTWCDINTLLEQNAILREGLVAIIDKDYQSVTNNTYGPFGWIAKLYLDKSRLPVSLLFRDAEDLMTGDCPFDSKRLHRITWENCIYCENEDLKAEVRRLRQTLGTIATDTICEQRGRLPVKPCNERGV